MEAPESKPQIFKKKAFGFVEKDYLKVLKIIDQAASMGQVEVNINNKDINNLRTISAILKWDGFEVIPTVTSNVTRAEIINITVSWGH